ncbi:hypothetical protein MMA64_26475, partial [Salmonella enterica]|nr:hypothetical protein [Salmonella enterica]
MKSNAIDWHFHFVNEAPREYAGSLAKWIKPGRVARKRRLVQGRRGASPAARAAGRTMAMPRRPSGAVDCVHHGS